MQAIHTIYSLYIHTCIHTYIYVCIYIYIYIYTNNPLSCRPCVLISAPSPSAGVCAHFRTGTPLLVRACVYFHVLCLLVRAYLYTCSHVHMMCVFGHIVCMCVCTQTFKLELRNRRCRCVYIVIFCVIFMDIYIYIYIYI